jgi:hypothetical protein
MQELGHFGLEGMGLLAHISEIAGDKKQNPA